MIIRDGTASRGQIGQVGFDMAVDQIGDAGGRHPGFSIAQRVTAIINDTPQCLRLLARGGDRPFRPSADGKPALTAFNRFCCPNDLWGFIP